MEQQREHHNYYNYYTEIEDHFVRRRGKNLLVSPLDWSLIATWKETGIPLRIVLRGIDRAFDGFEARARKGRLVNSLFYCHQAVMEAFEEYRESRVGSDSQASAPPVDQRPLLEFFQRKLVEIEEARPCFQNPPWLAEEFEGCLARLRELDQSAREMPESRLESLERDLSVMDQRLLAAVEKVVEPGRVEEWKKQGKAALRIYKRRVDKETYEKIFANFLRRKLREAYRLPQFTLFQL
ncbi:MAG: hypothetical protein HY652_08915 [Acidobacteria bacterium]|nr:hypothetical protein [Acidobacteriota bacterium]